MSWNAEAQLMGTLPLDARPFLDDILRDEVELASRDHAPLATDLEVNPGTFRKYAEPSNLWDWREMAAVLLGDLRGKKLLDYGCRTGEESVYFAKLGARVTSIDCSELGVASLKRRAARHGLGIHAYEMRCDSTSFAGASFDLIHGMGILHHVGIDAALAEVWRLLRPGGRAVFLEPVGDRLTWREIEDATRRFSRAATYPYHLLYRLKRFLPRSLYDAVRRVDHGLLSMAPGLRRYAGAVVIQVVK